MLPEKGREHIYDAALKEFHRREVVLTRGTRTAKAMSSALLKGDSYLTGYINEDDAEVIFKKFVRGDLFIKHEDEFADTFYEYSKALTNRYIERLKDADTPLAKWEYHGDAWMNSALKRIFDDNHSSETKVSKQEEIPASDRIVSLKDNQPKVQEAKDAVDAVINAVIGNNEYGAKSPEEKEALVGALKSGRILLDADEVKESTLQNLLISALQYVADNFAKGAITALGAAAVAKVLGLF